MWDYCHYASHAGTPFDAPSRVYTHLTLGAPRNSWTRLPSHTIKHRLYSPHIASVTGQLLAGFVIGKDVQFLDLFGPSLRLADGVPIKIFNLWETLPKTALVQSAKKVRLPHVSCRDSSPGNCRRRGDSAVHRDLHQKHGKRGISCSGSLSPRGEQWFRFHLSDTKQ